MSKTTVYRCDGADCNKVLDDYHVRVTGDLFCRDRPGVDANEVPAGDYCRACLARALRIPTAGGRGNDVPSCVIATDTGTR